MSAVDIRRFAGAVFRVLRFFGPRQGDAARIRDGIKFGARHGGSVTIRGRRGRWVVVTCSVCLASVRNEWLEYLRRQRSRINKTTRYVTGSGRSACCHRAVPLARFWRATEE